MKASVSLLPADVSDPTLSALDQLSLDLAMARGIDEVMEVVRRNARGLIGADGISFILRDNGRCYYADEDAIAPLWKGQRFPMDTCISGWAMQHGEVVVIEDIDQDERIPKRPIARPSCAASSWCRFVRMIPLPRSVPIGHIAIGHRPRWSGR